MTRIRMIPTILVTTTVFLFLWGGCAGKRGAKPELEAEGLRQLKKQVQKAPQDVGLRLQLAEAYLRADSVTAALGEAQKAFVLDSSSAVARALLGVCELRAGKEESGLRHVVVALADPSFPRERVQELGRELGHPFHIERISTGQASAAFPYPSPDGKKIAFQGTEGGNWDVYVLDVETGEARRLTDSEDAEENPTFSPNGKVIAYTRARTASAAAGQLGQRDIYLAPVDGGSQMVAVTDSADDWYPRFSRDGKKLYFVSERDDQRPVPATDKLSDIYVLDLTKKAVVRLTNNDYDDNAPNPFKRDRMLLYTANKNGRYDLFVLDLHKLQSSSLLTAAEAGLEDIGSPSVTPDGAEIAFVGTRAGNYDIYIYSPGDQSLQRLTRAAAVDHAPVFDTAHNRILFHSNRSGNFGIYVVDLSKPVDREELLGVLQEELASVKEGDLFQGPESSHRRNVGG